MRLMKDNALSMGAGLNTNTKMLLWALCVSFVFCEMSLSLPQAVAQQANWQGGARGTAARAIGQRWRVGVSQAHLYAGPSVAYSKRGRVYEGEELTILEVTRSQEWAEVSAPSGARGWIKVSSLNRPQDRPAQDAGRYRRQNDYQYDAQGRRVDLKGRAVGSGQGTGNQTQNWRQADRPSQPQAQDWKSRAPQNGQFRDDSRYQQNQYNDESQRLNADARDRAFSRQGTQASRLSLRLPIGMSNFTRRFTSNVGTAPLSGLKTQVISPNFGLMIDSQIKTYLSLSARYMKTMGGEAPLPALASLPEVGEVNLPASQQTAELLVGLGTRLDVGWADKIGMKGLLGAQYYEASFTPVQYPAPAEKMSPLQDHRYISALLGLELSLVWEPITWIVKGGGALPLSFEQSPNSEGQWKSLGLWTQTQVNYALSRSLSLGLILSYMRIASEYTGPAEQADYTLSQPIYYTEASGYDQNIEALLTIGYSL